MAHPSAPSTSMLSFIQQLLASTSNASLSRKRKRSPGPISHLQTTTTTTDQDKTTSPASDVQHNDIGTSSDREKETALFLALAGQSPLTKRVKTAGETDGGRINDSVKRTKKKLSVISEEDDGDRGGGDQDGDVSMEDIPLYASPGEQQVWTHRSEDEFQH